MKTPKQYADELVEKYHNLLFLNIDSYFVSFRHPEAKKCAIIDVKNTIEALRCIDEQIHIKNYDYYKEVLNILESKL